MSAVKANGVRSLLVSIGASVLALAGCASPVLDRSQEPTAVVVGTGDGAAAELLAHLYAGALRNTGVDVRVHTEPGARGSALAALDSGDVTLVPGYTGRLLRHYDPGAEQTDAEEVFDALARALPDELTISDYAAAQDRAMLAVSRSFLSERDDTEVADLAPRCPELAFAATPEFEVAGGLDALARLGCEPRAVETVDTAAAMRAAADDRVVAAVTTADPALAEASGESEPATPGPSALPDLTSLPDAADRTPRDRGSAESADTESPVFAAQNVVPVFRKGALAEPQLDALRVVAGELTTADLAEMLARVDDGQDPTVVAEAWLAERA